MKVLTVGRVKKRGQITTFIILGVLLLLLIFFTLYFYARERIPEESIFEAVTVPMKVQPIQEYAEACLKQTARDGLVYVGDHGGYTDISQLRANSFSPTKEGANAARFSPESPLIIPYWWYLKTSNNCEKTKTCSYASQRPKLTRKEGSPSIEEELDSYIEKNIKDCLRDFEPFKKQGIVIEPKGGIVVTSKITAERVMFELKYPLIVRQQGEEYRLERFVAEEILNLKEIYNVATEIVNMQATHNYFEKHTRNLISLFSSRDEDMLPPASDVSVLFGDRVVWIKPMVKRRLQDVLAAYIPLLQVFGTRNYHYLLPPADARDPELYDVVYNRNMVVPMKTAHTSLGVYFTYLPQWEPYFDLNCNGDSCGPESFGTSYFLLTLIGLHRYHFAYDISYPVLVEVQNPFVFEGRGYSFKFFIEANMRNNEPLTLDHEPLQYTGLYAEGPSLFCNPNTWTSGEVTVKIIDGVSKKGADDVSISYKCGEELCAIGNTEKGELSVKFPRCIGGELIINREDTTVGIERLDTGNEAQEVSLVIEPYRLKEVEVRKYEYKRGATGEWNLDEVNLGYLKAKEEATLILQHKDSDFMASITQIGTTLFSDTEEKMIRLLPGEYEVQVVVTDSEEMLIPEREECIEGECFTYPKMEFGEKQPFPKSTIQYSVVITKKDLDKAGKIIFPVIVVAEDKIPQSKRRIEDMEAIGALQELAKGKEGLLQPKFEP